MKILYMSPRLDISFKPTPHVPLKEGPPNNPVRLHYVEFEKRIKEHCEKYNHELTILKKPMWEFTPDDANNYDIGLMIHREKHDFPGENILYCMQMGLPWLFSIDRQGWCASASDWPLQYENDNTPNTNLIELKETMVSQNISKFQQNPNKIDLPEEFILFTAQLPHDTTISNHSNVSVNEALIKTLEFGKRINVPVVAKGHPINLGSMKPLIDTFKKYGKIGDIWTDSANIHQCLEECSALFTVNSGGTGLEAIIHEKPIFIFGRADYQSIALNGENADELWNERDKMIKCYPSFMEKYYNTRYHVAISESFNKLEGILNNE